ncbi:MAG TPA: hypothetical protein VFL81_03505 [Candidatus Saccharimonadales bacterium]|nr:hypothetical protein [Candidatus Saccharimonadales bacterium]
MARFPQIDLPDDFPIDFELSLHDKETFEKLHVAGEKINYFYAIAHRAITLAGEPSYDNPFLLKSLSTGIKAYELVDALVDDLAGDSRLYTDQDEMTKVYAGTRLFVEEIKRPDDFFQRADYALTRMREDAPNLAETVHEIIYRHVDHDKVGAEAALKGAAVIRSMQINIDRRLAA